MQSLRVESPHDLPTTGPTNPSAAFYMVANLSDLRETIKVSTTSDVRQGYAGIEFPAGDDGLVKKVMHEMRHMDPLAHVAPSGTGWQVRPFQERDADWWAEKKWDKLNDLSK